MLNDQNGNGDTTDATGGSRLRHVALIVESAVAPRRMMLSGVARYVQEHEPWAIYLKPFGVEQSLPMWLEKWHGDGIIAAVRDAAGVEMTKRGIPIVDVVGALKHEDVPLVHTNDHAVGRLGAEHLMERGFVNLAYCEYDGQFWSIDRRKGFEATAAETGLVSGVYRMPLPGPGTGGPESW